MTSIWIVGILLVVVSSVTVIGADNVRYYNLKAQRLTQYQFDWYRRKIHKSWDEASFGCARLCYGDEQCTGMMVCPDVCHLFGVLDMLTSPAKKTDYKTCDVFMMNRCKNNGFANVDGSCRCRRGYGGRFCEDVIRGEN